MNGRRSFKSDESFLEKISIGATGTKRVFEDLKEHGHNPLELERGSMSFKIWKNIKIKRIRVPDILCTDCSRRVESRAKTKLEISMSHSISDPERGWDYGLDNNDYIAFVVCKRVGEKPTDWCVRELVQYVNVGELRSAEASRRAFLVRPKGAEEGFESRINWPASIANTSGVIKSIDQDSIKYQKVSGSRLISLKLSRKGLKLTPLVSVGDSFIEDQVLAAVVPVLRSFPCERTASGDYYISKLSSPSLSERYAAAKALSFYPDKDVTKALAKKIQKADEHIYIKLEAAAVLFRQEDPRGFTFIEQCLKDNYLQNRLEAIIVLGEISNDSSCKLLTKVLMDNEQHPEIRAGAAWSLGELQNKLAIAALVDSFVNVNESIRVEAARALAKLASQFSPEIVKRFSSSAPEKRPGIAWALSRSGKFGVEDMLSALVDNDARQWVAYMLGTQDQQKYIYKIEELKKRDPEVYFAVTVLWKIMTSWIYGLEEF